MRACSSPPRAGAFILTPRPGASNGSGCPQARAGPALGCEGGAKNFGRSHENHRHNDGAPVSTPGPRAWPPMPPPDPRERDRTWTHVLTILLVVAGLGGLLIAMPVLMTPGVCSRAGCPVGLVVGILVAVPLVAFTAVAGATKRLAHRRRAAPTALAGLIAVVLLLALLLHYTG